MLTSTLDTLHLLYTPGHQVDLPADKEQPRQGNKIRLPVNTSVIPGFTGKLFPSWFSSANLIWFPDPAWPSPVFDVYRSESPEGPFVKLNATPLSDPSYRDETTLLASKYQHDYYVIQAWQGDVSLGYSAPITHENVLSPWHYLRKKEINRREWILLSRYNGVRSLVLKKVQHGKYGYRCSRCWDAVRRMSVDDFCPVCFGTTYQGGYYRGIDTLLNYDSVTEADSPTDEGRTEPATLQAWTVAYPNINANDLIIHIPERRVYRVERVQNTVLQTVTVRQLLVMVQLPPSCVEYLLLEREGVIDQGVIDQ
jgi:hypothetical protein